MSEQEEFEWIENFLLDRLSLEERSKVLEKIKIDPDFKTSVENYSKTHIFIKDMKLEEILKNKLVELQNKDRSQFVLKRRLKYFVSVASIAAIIFIVFLSGTEVVFPDTENDFNITRGIDTSAYTIEQKYAFSTFFDGQAHLAEGQYLLASQDFEKSLLVTNTRPYFREAAQWHLAVAYLKSEQVQKAEKIYTQLSDCDDCEYPVSKISKWKLWVKIQLKKLF
ncbi:hypothetical protein EGI22_04185 [Lacihabitans sp. LS3-19]|uniref:tetratricopeptide repeat protein n=1 Tax=Lacihabitans sp. LS3-19 TaxID=2487335 RepID=UPI0020CC1428|nr:hypothetical protein [Lacihabitans sp. LS3-19]MCP9767096.1 hypothetical protein [Lacihabitans sp. LS3-19]